MAENVKLLTVFLLRTLPGINKYHPRRVRIRKFQFKLFDTENSELHGLNALLDNSFKFFRAKHPKTQQYQISTTKNIDTSNTSLFGRGMGYRLTAQYRSNPKEVTSLCISVTDFLGKQTYIQLEEMKVSQTNAKFNTELLFLMQHYGGQHDLLIAVDFHGVRVVVDGNLKLSVAPFRNVLDRAEDLKVMEKCPNLLGLYHQIDFLLTQKYGTFSYYRFLTNYLRGICATLGTGRFEPSIFADPESAEIISLLLRILKSVLFCFVGRTPQKTEAIDTKLHLTVHATITELITELEEMKSQVMRYFTSQLSWIDSLQNYLSRNSDKIVLHLKLQMDSNPDELQPHLDLFSWINFPVMQSFILENLKSSQFLKSKNKLTQIPSQYNLKQFSVWNDPTNEDQLLCRHNGSLHETNYTIDLNQLAEKLHETPIEDYVMIVPHSPMSDAFFILNFSNAEEFEISVVELDSSSIDSIQVKSHSRMPKFTGYPHDFRITGSVLGLSLLFIPQSPKDKTHKLTMSHCNLVALEPGKVWHTVQLFPEIEKQVSSISGAEMNSLLAVPSKGLIFASVSFSALIKSVGCREKCIFVVWCKANPHDDTFTLISSQLIEAVPMFHLLTTEPKQHTLMEYKSQVFSLLHTMGEATQPLHLLVSCFYKNMFVPIGGSNYSRPGLYIFHNAKGYELVTGGQDEHPCGLIGVRSVASRLKGYDTWCAFLFLPHF